MLFNTLFQTQHYDSYINWSSVGTCKINVNNILFSSSAIRQFLEDPILMRVVSIVGFTVIWGWFMHYLQNTKVGADPATDLSIIPWFPWVLEKS